MHKKTKLSIVTLAILTSACNSDTYILGGSEQQSESLSAFKIVPNFYNADAQDVNGNKAQVEGDGEFIFKLGTEQLTYPLTFRSLIPTGFDTPVARSFIVGSEHLNIASSITTFVSRGFAFEQESMLNSLQNTTGITKDRLLGDFVSSNDVETAKVARFIYYTMHFYLDDEFKEYFIQHSSGNKFTSITKDFLVALTEQSLSENNPVQYYFTQKLIQIHEVIFDQKASQSAQAQTDISTFLDKMKLYRNYEYQSYFNAAGANNFRDSVTINDSTSYPIVYENNERYFKSFTGQSAKAHQFTSRELVDAFPLSQLNVDALTGPLGPHLTTLFNQLIEIAHSNKTTNYYTPDELLSSIRDLYNLFVNNVVYERNDLIKITKEFLNLEINPNIIRAISYETPNIQGQANTWLIQDYINFINNLATYPDSDYKLDIGISDSRLLETNIEKNVGVQVGDTLARIKGIVFKDKLLDDSDFDISLSGSDVSFFNISWDDATKEYILTLAKPLIFTENKTLEVMVTGTWDGYDQSFSLSESVSFNVDQNKELFDIINIGIQEKNPAAQVSNRAIHLKFSKPIDISDLDISTITISTPNIHFLDAAIDPNNDTTLILTIDESISSGIIVPQVIERDKGTIYAYANGSGEDSNGAALSTSYVENFYNDSSITTLDLSQAELKGINFDGSKVELDSQPTAVDRIVYRGISYELTRSPISGKIYFAQNLGAIEKCDDNSVSAARTLATCRGDYYQISREPDGHQIFNNPNKISSSVEVVDKAISFEQYGFSAHSSNFISFASNQAWTDVNLDEFRKGTDNVLASDTSGMYCPVGYRVMPYEDYEVEMRGLEPFIADGKIASFAESFLYFGHAGARIYDGTWNQGDLYVIGFWGARSGYNLVSRGIGFTNNMTQYAGASYRHFDKRRTSSAFNLRCVRNK